MRVSSVSGMTDDDTNSHFWTLLLLRVAGGGRTGGAGPSDLCNEHYFSHLRT